MCLQAVRVELGSLQEQIAAVEQDLINFNARITPLDEQRKRVLDTADQLQVCCFKKLYDV